MIGAHDMESGDPLLAMSILYAAPIRTHPFRGVYLAEGVFQRRPRICVPRMGDAQFFTTAE